MKAGLVIIAAIIIGGLTVSLVQLVKVKHACEEAVLASQLRVYVGPEAEAQRDAEFKAALASEACLQTQSMSLVILSLVPNR